MRGAPGNIEIKLPVSLATCYSGVLLKQTPGESQIVLFNQEFVLTKHSLSFSRDQSKFLF